MLVGVIINAAILLCMFWNQLWMSHPSLLHPQLSPLNPQRTPANDVEKNMPQSNGAKQGCAHVSGMKNCLTKKELFLKGFV
ncbi:hypothetical protein Cni_G05136 [Canna indica]|uniref:Uncharacterized protein n=1 Tax=Canna indica TaxID=4628 RepID=A0AAQ3Q563_9LILI|nr:hypothetical protein Cni_G05136 [Canna indica]